MYPDFKLITYFEGPHVKYVYMCLQTFAGVFCAAEIVYTMRYLLDAIQNTEALQRPNWNAVHQCLLRREETRGSIAGNSTASYSEPA